MIPKYIPSQTQVHVGSSGFTNYWPVGRGSVADLVKDVLTKHPGSVIVNGDDDWFAHESKRPESFLPKLGIHKLALFHTGISGISSSGAVLDRKEFLRLEDAYRQKYGKLLRQNVSVYEEG